MRWSAARARYEPFLAESVAGRLELHATRYRRAADQEGRGWITWDGRQVASFESIPFMVRQNALSSELQNLGRDGHEAWDRAAEAAHHEGLLYLEEFEGAVEGYPELSLEAALASPHPLTRALAMLDRRLGKRRLATGEFAHDPNALVRRFHEIRCVAEGIEAALSARSD